jgi:zinc protease
MKRIFLFILILLTAEVKAFDIVELKLPKSDIIVIKLFFRTGSVDDPETRKGIANLTANLVADGGTATLTSTQVQDKLYPMAASISVSVDKEVTIFTFQVHRELLSSFYPIVRELILSPRFDSEDFTRIKSNQQNYVEQVVRNSNDEEYGKKLLENFLFVNNPFQSLVAGTTSGVEAITLEEVELFYNSHFGAANLTVGIAGNYTGEFLMQLRKDYTFMNPRVEMPIRNDVQVTAKQGYNVKIIAKDNALGSAISAGFPMDITRSNDDFAALMVANSWLGEHRKSYSRLYKKIREERSMNYGDYTYIEWYSAGGSNMLPRPGYPRSENYFSIWLRPVQTAKGLKGQYEELKDIETGHAHFAIRMALSEMSKLLTNGMSQKDFDLTRQFLRSYMKLYAQTPEQKLGYLLDSKFYGRNDWLAEADLLLADLTLDRVNEVMRRYWQTSNMEIVIVTDRSEVVPLARSLRDNAPSPMTYSNALKAVLPETILAEDKEVQVFPMKSVKVEIFESNDMFR